MRTKFLLDAHGAATYQQLLSARSSHYVSGVRRTGWTSLFCPPLRFGYNSPTWQNRMFLRKEKKDYEESFFFFFLTESLLCNLKHVGKHVLIICWTIAVWGFIAISDTTCFKVFLFKHKSFYIFTSEQKQRWLLHWNMSCHCQRSLWVW